MPEDDFHATPANGKTLAQSRVALISQEEILGQIIEIALRSNGTHLTPSPCEAAYLDGLCDNCPDLIVQEEQGSNPASLDLCQTIRQIPALNHTKLVLVQDRGRPIDRRRTRALGADGFLAMPFAMTALCDEIGRLLEV